MQIYNKIYQTEQFPLQKGSEGYFSLVYGDDAIRISLLTLLLTKPGERVFLPDFGCRLHELAFEQNDLVFDTLLEDYVLEAIRTYEPRISIQAISVIHQKNNNKVDVRISFIINKPGNPQSTFSFSMDRQSGNIDLSRASI